MNVFKHKSNTSRNSLHFVKSKRLKSLDQFRRPNHFHILVSHLAEFQKGQCIFWLAIAVAVLIGLAGSSETLDSHDIASFTTNVEALQVISVCGYIYTVIGLYSLHLVPHREWYIYLMSFVTTVFCGSAWGATFFARATDITPNTNNVLDRCGPINPETYCSSGQGDGFSWLGWISYSQIDSLAVVLGGVCMLGMLVDMIVHMDKHRKSRFVKAVCTCKLKNGEIPRWRSVVTKFIKALVELTFLFIWTALFITLVTLAQSVDTKAWGFGQIIAITIWFPMMLEYFHALYRGLERSMGYRIPPGFQLCPKPPGDVPNDTQAFATHHENEGSRITLEEYGSPIPLELISSKIESPSTAMSDEKNRNFYLKT